MSDYHDRRLARKLQEPEFRANYEQERDAMLDYYNDRDAERLEALEALRRGESSRLYRWVWNAGSLHRDYRIFLLGCVSGAAVMFAVAVIVARFAT